MENYRLTKKADNDLSSIYEYGLLNFGLSQAQSYLLGIYDRFQILAENPLFGHSAEPLSTGLKRSEYQSHIIFYMQDDKGVLIIRVLRGEMDFKRHL